MSFFEKIYNFDSQDAPSNTEWEFLNPDGTTELGVGSVGRKWNWEDKTTKSSRVGPDKPYSGKGYIYTESSYPTKDNDKFIMVTKNQIDASGRNTGIKFRYSANTNNAEVQLIVEVYESGIWRKEFDQNVSSNIPDWLLVDLDLSMYSNTDMLIRITVDMLKNGSTPAKDVGIDNIIITGAEGISDDLTEFLKVRDVRKLKKNVNTFDAQHMTKEDIKTVIDDLKIAHPSYVNYPRGVVIVETTNIVHLIKEVD